jgi:TraY domain
MKRPRKRNRDRQPRPAAEGKTTSVHFRLRRDLREKLEAASRASGRNLSDEVVWRLTMSLLFDNEVQAVSQIQRGLGEVMVEGLVAQGWGVGPEDPEGVVRAWLDNPQYREPIFMPPEQQQRLKRAA